MLTAELKYKLRKLTAFLFGKFLYINVYLPLYLLGQLLVILKLTRFKLNKLTGIGYKRNSTLAMVSHKHKVYDVETVGTDEEIDFITHRSGTYLDVMSTCIPQEIAKAALKLQDIPLISDSQLVYVTFNTGFSQSVTWDYDRDMFKVDLSFLQHFCVFRGFYYDVVCMRITPDGRKIYIEMIDGVECRSDDLFGKYNYNQAKLHLQVAMSLYAPAVSHNYVHFVFPTAVAHTANKMLSRGGVLYNLLKPHVRFTERINHQALRVSNSLNNKDNMLSRYFYVWQSFPVTKEQIVEGIAGNCKKHYVGEAKKDCQDEYIKTEKTHSKGLQSRVLTKDIVTPPDGFQRVHKLFPPDYVIDKNLQRIPYFNFLKQYYEVIYWYVKELEPHVNKVEWMMFKDYVSKFVPRFDEVDFAEGIATFITQAAVVHHCDHHSFYSYFMKTYGCTAIRVPFTPFEDKETWKQIVKGEKFTINQAMKNPMVMLHQRDIMRTKCFSKIYVRYNKNENLDLTLPKTHYEFASEEINQISGKFKSKLRTLDGNLKTQRQTMELPRSRNETRAVGLQVIPLDEIVNSICY